MTRFTVMLAVFGLAAGACESGSEQPSAESQQVQPQPWEGPSPASEQVLSAEPPEPTEPPLEAPDSETNGGEGPYLVGGDVEPPRRLKGSKLGGALVDMMRSGQYAWGACIFTVTVSESGEVGNFRFLKPEDLAPEVRDAILDTVEAWRFSPATKSGQPVPVDYTLVIHHCPYRKLASPPD